MYHTDDMKILSILMMAVRDPEKAYVREGRYRLALIESASQYGVAIYDFTRQQYDQFLDRHPSLWDVFYKEMT